jgi:transcription elongation GreA/GreB family factor
MMAKYLTKFGMAAIREKIAYLQCKQEQALASAGAAAQNDTNAYHDNFEYEEGMRQQEMFSQRLRTLWQMLEGAMVAPEPLSDERAAIGHYVLVRRLDEPAEGYVLCGEGEGALFDNACSASSPMGRTLLGMAKGESRTVDLGNRSYTVEMLDIRPAKSEDLESSES